MLKRRGFLAVLAGVLGAAFLPKKAKSYVPPVRPTTTPVYSEFQDQFHRTTALCSRSLDGRHQPDLVNMRLQCKHCGEELMENYDDPADALMSFRMEEAGNTMREMLSNALWNEKHF